MNPSRRADGNGIILIAPGKMTHAKAYRQTMAHKNFRLHTMRVVLSNKLFFFPREPCMGLDGGDDDVGVLAKLRQRRFTKGYEADRSKRGNSGSVVAMLRATGRETKASSLYRLARAEKTKGGKQREENKGPSFLSRRRERRKKKQGRRMKVSLHPSVWSLDLLRFRKHPSSNSADGQPSKTSVMQRGRRCSDP